MRSDLQFVKNFRRYQAIGCSGINKELDFASARTIGWISNCRFNVRDPFFSINTYVQTQGRAVVVSPVQN